jgi:hypothetical protein
MGFGEVEFVAFAAIGAAADAAAAACGELKKADLSVLAFERETWDLGEVVDSDAFVDVYANKNT